MTFETEPFELKRPHARLEWTEAGPIAPDAGDVYFSAEDGLAETRSVFLQAAGFPDRFAKDRPTIVAELGFGTGLNFLALWDLFRRTAPETARLHFVSVEGFPLHVSDLTRALSAFPELRPLSDQLIAAWPSPHKGPHRRVFENGRVMLTVFHDLAEAALPQMEFQADAWFLDGFAPAKNPDMWAETLFSEVARLSAPGCPAVTFTVAGFVRRGLAAAGFEVSKQPGFGRKRERLEAIYQGGVRQELMTPFTRPSFVAGSMAIIGGGIAAASLVHAFRLRGRTCDVYAQGGWSSGASGAPKGLLTPRLEASDRPHNRALLAAFDYAKILYTDFNGFEASGVLRQVEDGASQDRLRMLAERLDEDFTFHDAEHTGLWMAGAGQFKPVSLVKALAEDADIKDLAVIALERTDEGWLLIDCTGDRYGPYAGVVFAGGWGNQSLLSGQGLVLEPTAGSVGVFESSEPSEMARAWGGYTARAGQHRLIGATHVKQGEVERLDVAEPALRALADASPGGAIKLGALQSGWAGVRAAVPDRLPLLGTLPGPDYADFWRGYAQGGQLPSQGLVQNQGLFVLSAFGARGFAHAPLLAEALVSGLCGEPLPLQGNSLDVLHPARFLFRRLRRGG